MKVCAITGHRPTRFKFKYDESNNGCKRLKKRLREQIELLYAQGIRCYCTGGAMGVDIWASEILMALKETPGYSDIELILALPFQGYDAGWDPKSCRRLETLKRKSAAVRFIGTRDISPAVCYRLRNQYMVDHADCLLAVYDNNQKDRSGTGMAVHYAKKKGIPVTLIHPDTVAVSSLA